MNPIPFLSPIHKICYYQWTFKYENLLITYATQFIIMEPPTVEKGSLAYSCLLGPLLSLSEKLFNNEYEYKIILNE